MRIFDISQKLIDLASLAIAFLLAAGIVANLDQGTSFADFLSMRIKISYSLIFAGFMLTCLIILVQCGLYKSKATPIFQVGAINIITATLFGTGVLMLIAELLDISIVTTKFLIFFWFISSFLLILNKIIIQYVLKKLRLKGLNLLSVLVIGTNERALSLAKMMESHPELGYRIQGFVDNSWLKCDPFINSGYQVVATIDELPSYLWKNPVDEVIICLPLGTFYHEVANIIALIESQGITVRIPADFFNLKVAKSKVERFENEDMITMETGSMFGWSLMVKRAIDIIGSALLLVILSPLLFITAILIKSTSSGPIFFVQDRVGFNKRLFKMYKFRTMVIDAEKKQAELEKLNEVSGPVFKISHDPRIIPIGQMLRKLSIDELPQLLNVFKGDMSLVGPRPLPMRDFNGFSEVSHCRRFSVKPGITCLWQIKGRSNISFDRWMELDMEYIDHWSLWLDIKILLGTITAVIKGSGAA
ncbi:MAG: sugar transferase [Methylococcales bacterium]